MGCKRVGSPQRREVAALLCAGAALGSCTALAEDSGFRIPASQFHERVYVLCLDAPALEQPFDGHEDRLASFESMLAEELGTAGFRVVGSAETTAKWRELMGARSDYYDPHTGVRIEAHYRQARRDAFEGLRDALGCDAVVNLTIALVRAPLDASWASWDGRRERPGDLFATARGIVPAFSVWVRIRDMQDEDLYFGTGGIEVLGHVRGGLLSPLRFDEADPKTLLADPQRNREAVRLALERLRGSR